jgi:thymidylate synthase (FAD)
MKKKLFIEDNVGFVERLDVFGSDLTVANAARVSFYKESHLDPVFNKGEDSVVKYVISEKDKKLIRFLAKHSHVTPFFHPTLRFRIKMPIFVAREWFRHTVGFARNEVSRRYVTEAPEVFVPKKLRQWDQDIKQGSKDDPVLNNEFFVGGMRKYCQEALKYYDTLLKKGVCPEQARMILPQSMYTEFVETASLSAYARLVKLRNNASAQREIQNYAKLLSVLIEPCFPVSWEALIDKKKSQVMVEGLG